MREHPILFSGPMVRAILAGTKTQTRRVVKPQPQPFQSNDRPGRWWWFNVHRKGWPEGRIHEAMLDAAIIPFCPYGAPGDRLWVRETWKPWPNTAGPELRGPDDMGAIYAATWDKSGGHGWKPSIHMPRWASRITLEVTGVRVERLQEISEADAQAEGVEPNWSGPLDGWSAEEHGFIGVLDTNADDQDGYFRTAREAFQQLWDSINATRGYGWESNPWVWVVEFKAVQL